MKAFKTRKEAEQAAKILIKDLGAGWKLVYIEQDSPTDFLATVSNDKVSITDRCQENPASPRYCLHVALAADLYLVTYDSDIDKALHWAMCQMECMRGAQATEIWWVLYNARTHYANKDRWNTQPT